MNAIVPDRQASDLRAATPIAVGFYGVTKTFAKGDQRLTVLEQVTLETAENEFTCIVGPSGCGKSTLLNLVSGLSPADDGRVEFRGRAVTSVNNEVGYITQDSNLLPWCTVLENIELPLEIRRIGKSPGERRDLALTWITQVGLEGFEKHYPHQLSGGMQKRVSIARTLVYDPDVILMDEPFGPLDAMTKMTLQNLLLKLWQERKKTIIFVTHDLTEAILLGDRVAMMTRRPGTIKAVLPVQLPRPRDAFSLSETPDYAAIHRQFWTLMRSEVDG